MNKFSAKAGMLVQVLKGSPRCIRILKRAVDLTLCTVIAKKLRSPNNQCYSNGGARAVAWWYVCEEI
jgi:hypothetical protein